MNATGNNRPSFAVNPDHKAEPSKLISLLALAASAAAIPQTGNADIIYTPGGSTVSIDSLHNFVIDNLPGNAQLGFRANQKGMFTITSTRSVTLAKRGSGYLNMKLNLIGAGHLWGTIAGAIASQAVMATAQDSVHSGNSFNNLYLLFEFKDSSLPSDPLRYGWVNLSLANGNLSTLFDYPSLAIGGWAYDTTGAQIRSGAVPEPGSMSFLALGALALGARGVRSWRRNRRGE